MRLGVGVRVAVLFVAMAAEASAQSGSYPAGVGSVALSYQRIRNTGHRLSDGFLLAEGQSLSQALLAEVAYGVTDKLTLTAGLPFVAARYTGAGPTPFAFLPVDADRRWHGSFQDFGMGGRWALTAGSIALTPSLNVILPSHAYDYRGEAVVGARLKEMHIGLGAARALGALSSRLDIEARAAYAFVEGAAVDVANDRSNASLEAGFLLTSRLQAVGSVRWQRTHGGLRAGSFTGPLPLPGEIDTPLRIAEHDRILRDNNTHLAIGLAYSLGRVDLHSSYLYYLSGTDTHAGGAVTVGAAWYFGKIP